MSRYRCSDGTLLSKSVIDMRVRISKSQVLQQQIDEFGYNFCVDCGRNTTNTRIECSHDISVDKAQKMGKAEFSYDVKNIHPRCHDCHSKMDGLNIMNPKQ